MIALASAGSLTTVGLLLGVAALLGLWAQSRRRTARLDVTRHTVALGGQQAVHVVELEGRRLVIGTGPGAAPRLLTELSPRPTARGSSAVSGASRATSHVGAQVGAQTGAREADGG